MRTYSLPSAYYTLLLTIALASLWSCEEPEAPQLPPTPTEGTITKSAPPANARIADGFFPLAWYTGVEFADALPEIKASGVNTVMPYINIERQSLDDLETYLDQANELELKVCVQIPRKWITDLQFASTVPGEPNTRPGAIRRIREFVDRFRSHPALLTWYMFDEPGLAQINPVATDLGYEIIKEEDPDHPISVVFNGTAVAGSEPLEERFLENLDILMLNYYPAQAGYPEFGSPRWPDFASVTAQGASLAADKQAYWSVLQASESENLGFRFPTEAEERFMIYTSIVSDATGLFFYTYSRFRNGGTEWIEDVLKPMIAEFKPMIPAVTAGPLNGPGNEAIVRDENTAGLELRYRLFQDPSTNLFYLVVVNRSDQTGSATIGVQPGQAINEISDRSTDQSLSFTNEGSNSVPDYVFQDTFAPYGAVVYELVAAPPTAGEGTITINAQGDCGVERMELRVDGEPVDAWTVSTTPGDYTYRDFDGGEVSVHFINDSFDSDNSCDDNNLLVDYIEVCGTRYQTEEVATETASCCTWDPDKLFTNGNFNFGTLSCEAPPAPNSPTSGQVVIRAQGSIGDERMRLLVDGQEEKTWTNVSTEPTDYFYDGYAGGTISVRFDNDAGSGSTDRNLGLDYIEVCGTRYEAESATRAVVEGCQATFAPWAWLWCNGDFTFGDVGCSAF